MTRGVSYEESKNMGCGLGMLDAQAELLHAASSGRQPQRGFGQEAPGGQGTDLWLSVEEELKSVAKEKVQKEGLFIFSLRLQIVW